MTRLPVIVAQGGISSAGRTSGFNAYKRLVFDHLSKNNKQSVMLSLRQLCKASLSDTDFNYDQYLLENTLVRKIDQFNTSKVPIHQKLKVQHGTHFVIHKNHIKDQIPSHWRLLKNNDDHLVFTIDSPEELFQKQSMDLGVDVAGQLPRGFSPEKLYSSRAHPKGISMTVYGASDAIGSLGISIEDLYSKVSADEISVYAGSSMSQLDQNGNGGLLQARLRGERISAKQLPLGFAEMPADFINAYILGNLGSTGTNMGACATFLYNLRMGAEDIRNGHSRIAIVGNSEAPLTPEIIEGYARMGALATNKGLMKLDQLKHQSDIDYRKACRPFAENCGFVLSESAQFFMLMDEELALECGATILGSVADVYINADGYKKSISSPGVGNYITMAKSAAFINNYFGKKALQHSFVHAHGTGTPQNRTTESHILNMVAETFKVDAWKISAIKSHVGHSLATAAGDQLMATLGTWLYGMIPGIETIQNTASDVQNKHLDFLMQAQEVDTSKYDFAILNSKGFGGNNASAVIISPQMTKQMITTRHGQKAMTRSQVLNEKVTLKSNQYEKECFNGEANPIYKFGLDVIQPEEVHMDKTQITLNDKTIPLKVNNYYADCIKKLDK